MSDAPEPTLRDVLTELRALRRDHGAKLETLTREVETLGRDTRAQGAKLETLTREVETLGRELLTELPPAVVTAVDRTLGERVRDLERKVS